MAGIQEGMMDDRFFNECIALDEVSKLKAVLQAIPKWEAVALAEVKAIESADTSRMSPEQQHWHGEYVNDQYFMIWATSNAILAGLAVAVASTIENFMGMICTEKGIALRERANWGDKRPGVEQVIGAPLTSLTGFGSANRARLLANCFKHNAGKADQDLVDTGVGTVNEDIDFVGVNWNAMLADVRTFLLEIVSKTAAKGGD